jgi:hypothetical protein
VSHHIAAIYFVYKFTSGKPQLSDEHTAHHWINPATIATAGYKFISDDERQQLCAYFAG